MITGMEIAACQHMAVPAEVMQHIVNVESGYNPFAIGVVGGQLVRQPQNLDEALATVHMLDEKGYNYSLGVAQVNRANLSKYGLTSYEQAFDVCPNLTAGARILSECYASSGNDWGKSFSCYYSGNFVTGYRDGYVQKIYDSINGTAHASGADAAAAAPIQLANEPSPSSLRSSFNGLTPVIGKDSASYRLAIRSIALDTAAAAATRALTGSTTTMPTAASGADTAPSPPAPANESAAAGVTGNSAHPSTSDHAEKAAGSGDVFEPQIRSLGEASTPSVSAAADGQSKIANASPSSVPATDSAELKQGGHDDAFVF